MSRRAFRVVWLVSMVALMSARQLAAQALELPLVYSGDGLTIIVTEYSEQRGLVSGQIRRGNDTYQFTGRISEDGDAEVVRGTFTVGDQKFAFTTRQEEDSEVVTFTTGDKSYRLRPAAEGEAKPVEQPKPAPVNPLDGDGGGQQNPAERPIEAARAPVQAPQQAPPAERTAPQPQSMRLTLHAFRDVTMGGVVSHAVALPEGWTSTGQTEWSGGELSYPQHKFEIDSPDGARIRFIPAITLSYTEVNPVPGFEPIPPQGVPAPNDFPRWLVQAVQQTNPKVSNVALIESQRLPKVEQMHDQFQRETGANDAGMQREVHLITLEYDEAGVRRREEAIMLYVRYAPIINQNINSQMWSVFTTFIVSAPKDKFAGMKPQLYTIAGSVRPTPQWWTQSQALLAELSRIRTEERWKSIRRRGEMINQMSDADYARYRKSIHSDSAQRDRINTIYETDDFKDTNGSIVNLPMHYHHVFSDGKGNYVLSNNSQDKPGELWNEITPMK